MSTNLPSCFLYCIHTKKLSCLKSGVEFDMNDILYEFKNLHHFRQLNFWCECGINSIFKATFEVSSKLYFVEIS